MTSTQSTTKQRHPSAISSWIEAMRLRTLPVSAAGVVTASALAIAGGCFKWSVALTCLLFALLAQIASNFANEYFDFRDGIDKKDRIGPRRGVTEGDITPRAMLAATFATLAAASLLGLTLVLQGGWPILIAGTIIVAGALAYSTGPYPLSRHGLGEVAVVLFFGVAPVTLTYYLQAGYLSVTVWAASVSIGLLGANVLISNNYRDIEADRSVGKTTLAVLFGRKAMRGLYLANGLIAFVLMMPAWSLFNNGAFGYTFQLMSAISLWKNMQRLEGRQLTRLLAASSLMMFVTSLIMLALALVETI